MQNFNPATAAEQVSSQMIPRLDNLNLSAEEYQEDLEILQEFNKIAAGMLNEEPGIEMPGNAQPIPLNEKTAMQGLSLFSEGLYLGITKCLEMGITGDVKKHLLQNLAMEVYSQAKQVVASTYGQEHTPDYQFTHEQQVEFICQGAESALMFFISEYEREYGAIAVSEPPARLLPKVEQAMMEDGVPLPDSIPASAPQKPKGPTPHDKYGAVALLLTTLPADQRARILRSFASDEKELIAFYSDARQIEQNLDIRHVEEHLQRFKEMLRQGGSGFRGTASRGIARLAKSYPIEKLLSCVKDERLLVKQYLESHYGIQNTHPSHGEGATAKQAANLLPSRIEEILYHFLSRRLEAST